MLQLIQELKEKNEVLYYFGLINLITAFFCIAMIYFSKTEVLGINAWYKPMKFALSTVIFCWSMLLYCSYLPDFEVKYFNWVVIICLGFEVIYILIQASRGQLSHFNISSPFYGFMFSLMAIAITIVVAYTAWIGILFFRNDFSTLPDYYVWAIRFGILIFVVFAFQGFMMGSRLSHTVGGSDGSQGLPVVNWSKKYGDLRIAHFLGMHSLQILPILAYYVIKNTKLVFVFAGLLLLITTMILVQALKGKPLF